MNVALVGGEQVSFIVGRGDMERTKLFLRPTYEKHRERLRRLSDETKKRYKTDGYNR